MVERILVTGANGLLGQALIRRLTADAWYDVLATGRDLEPRFPVLSCGYTCLDVVVRSRLAQVFEDFAPTTVVNCAAMTAVDRCETDRGACWNVNANSVRRIADECHAIGAHLIQVSTDFVFDGTAGPYDEKGRPNPVNFYGRSKLAGENAAREAGVDKWTVVRTNVVYGTGCNLPRHNFVSWVYDELSQGHPIQTYTDQIRTPTFADDLAAGIERIIRFSKRGLFHISGADLVNMHSFAHAVAKAFGLDSSLITPADSATRRQTAPRPRGTGLIILKAATELGYKPHSVEGALAHLAHRRSASPCDAC